MIFPPVSPVAFLAVPLEALPVVPLAELLAVGLLALSVVVGITVSIPTPARKSKVTLL
jgi:hypothetical protein